MVKRTMRWDCWLLAAMLAVGGSLPAQDAASNSSPQPKPPTCGPEVIGEELPYPLYKVGRDAKAPKPISSPDPEYAENARRAGTQGTVLMGIVVAPDETVAKAKVCKSLDPALDQKALETVNRWKFEPATKEGQAVAVFINVQVAFHLYRRH